MTHLVDSKIKLATCVRCGAYVFACTSGGLKIMADPPVLELDGVREALCARRSIYKLLTVAGRPDRMIQAGTEALRAGTGPFVGEHTACGNAGRNAVAVEAVPVPLLPSPCDAWRAQGGAVPPSCPRRHAGLLEGDDEGLPVSCPTCDVPPFLNGMSCDNCGRPVFKGQPYFAIECGEMKWVVHMTEEYANGMPMVGKRFPGAIPLQVELKRVGYMDSTVELSDYYNEETEAAVKRFYIANADRGWEPTTQIGPAGWEHLKSETRGAYLPDKPIPPQ